MWARLRLDIDWADLAYGLAACALPGDHDALARDAERAWSGMESPRGDRESVPDSDAVEDDAIACLSVRSGFDLLLAALHLPAGSEVLLTALTVGDMARIVRQHDLVPVPVDLVEDGFAPSLESLEAAVTPATRVLVVAHLFGPQIPLGPILDWARRHDLFVVEDCAQVYRGQGFRGHAMTDVSMFSFGPIKTATALGGAAICVRNRQLRRRMQHIQSTYRVQSRAAYFARLVKYSAMKAISPRPVFGAVARLVSFCGGDLDALLGGAVRNFPAEQLFTQLRQQPSAPLLRLLRRRWLCYDAGRVRRRTALGDYLTALLSMRAASIDGPRNVYWVFPVLVHEPDVVIERLRRAGFDATHRCGLSVIAAPADRPQLAPRQTERSLARIVFLPWCPEMSRSAAKKMAALLADDAALPSDWLAPLLTSRR